MGTSQSIHLTPNWKSTKQSVTAITKEGGGDGNKNYVQFMRNFSHCVRDANEHAGAGARGGGRGSFGVAGRNSAKRFAQFFYTAQTNGFDNALGLIFSAEELDNLKPEEFLLRLQEYLRGEESDSSFDDAAATVAMDEVLADVFKDCDDMDSIKDVFENSNEDKLFGWIVNFEVTYIIEYASSLLHSHIFQKEKDPDEICRQIKDWLRQELMNKLDEEEHPADLYSPQGQNYISELTDKIISIWG